MSTLAERIKKGLNDEGYAHVYTHTDRGGVRYPEHSHDKETAHIVLKGSIEITLNERVYRLGKGDRLDVPAYTEHSAYIDESGCTYVIGER